MSILSILEAISYVSTAGLLIAAMFGLKQLKISKDTVRLQSMRESMALASNQVRYYTETVIPKLDDLYIEITKKGLSVFEKSTFELGDDGVKISLKPNTKESVSQIFGLGIVILDVLNALESFSTYFTCGLADENIAYHSVGKSFCNTVGKYLPAIVLIGGEEHYKNIIELFSIWQGRVKEEALLIKKDSIDNELKNLNGKHIIPIGTSKY